MGKKAPKPPDLKPITDAQLKISGQMNDIALKQFGLSEQQFAYMKEQGQSELAFAREQADKNLALQERALAGGEAAQAKYDELTESQKRLMDQAYDYSTQDRQRYNDVAIPLQDKIIAEANAWDSPERQAQQAAQAQADVQRNADAQRRNVDSQLTGLGIDPSQMRAGAIANTMGLQTAAAGAMQGNNARQTVQQQGIAMRGNAANMVAGLPTQGAQQQSLASGNAAQAGNTIGQGQNASMNGINTYAGLGANAVSMRGGALGNYAQFTGSPTQWAGMGNQSMGMASNGIMNAGNVMNAGYSNRLNQFNAQAQATSGMLSGAGALAGGIAGFADGGEVGYSTEGGSPPEKKSWKERHDSMTPKERIRGAVDGFNAAGGVPDQYEAPAQENQLQQHFYAEGGAQRQSAMPVQQSVDRHPAMLADGEFVVPADVVRTKGLEFFERLVNKHHRVGT